jgi:hypothetical protein
MLLEGVSNSPTETVITGGNLTPDMIEFSAGKDSSARRNRQGLGFGV